MPVRYTKNAGAKVWEEIQAYRAPAARRAMADVLLNKLDEVLSRPGSGRIYLSRRGDGSDHQASAPGEPPAEDTGELRASKFRNARGSVMVVGVNHPAARALELGYGPIEPRPFMSVAREEAEEEMAAAAAQAIKKRSRKKPPMDGR